MSNPSGQYGPCSRLAVTEMPACTNDPYAASSPQLVFPLLTLTASGTRYRRYGQVPGDRTPPSSRSGQVATLALQLAETGATPEPY